MAIIQLMFRYRLMRRVHPSWLIATFCLGVCVGIISIQFLEQSLFSSISWFVVAGSLFIFSLWRPMLWVIPLVLISGILVGFWRGSLIQINLTPYTNLEGITLRVQGTVSEDTELDKRGNLVLRLHEIIIDDHTLPGSIWVTTKSSVDVRRSDRVTVHGKLQEGFGNFSATMYSAKLEHIRRETPGDVGLRVRDWFASAVHEAVPEPDASLGIGYLLGQRRGLPSDLEGALQVVGLTHIIVASGYNLTILVRLARRLFERVSKYLSFLAGSGMILGFIAITGVSPSMSRAGLVAGLALIAWYYGRKFHPVILLLFVAAITLLINPSYGWNDLGWQLSFAAFAGVMILAPLLQAYFFGVKKPGFIRQILGETISAQLATLPILVVAFGQFSNVALIANLLVLPLVPLAMLLTAFAGLGALTIPDFASVAGFPATVLLDYMVSVVRYFAEFPWAQTTITISWKWAIVFYMLAIGACVYMQRKTRFVLRQTNLVE